MTEQHTTEQKDEIALASVTMRGPIRVNEDLLGKAVAETIRRARRKRGITREQLATRIGVVRQYIYKVEDNVITPKIANLIRIAEGLDTTAWNLLRNAENLLDATGGEAPKLPSAQASASSAVWEATA